MNNKFKLYGWGVNFQSNGRPTLAIVNLSFETKEKAEEEKSRYTHSYFGDKDKRGEPLLKITKV